MIQSTESLRADVDGDADPNTTDSGPVAAAIAVKRAATVSSASSQLICSHPGSSAPFGAVRRSGCGTRSAWLTISGADDRPLNSDLAENTQVHNAGIELIRSELGTLRSAIRERV